MPDNLKVGTDGDLPRWKTAGEQRGPFAHWKIKPKISGLILKYRHNLEILWVWFQTTSIKKIMQ